MAKYAPTFLFPLPRFGGSDKAFLILQVDDARVGRHIRRFQQRCAALIDAYRLQLAKCVADEINLGAFRSASALRSIFVC